MKLTTENKVSWVDKEVDPITYRLGAILKELYELQSIMLKLDILNNVIYHDDLNISYSKRLDANCKVEILFSKDIEDENIWDNTPIQFKVFKTDKGDLGYSYLVPAGYSEYTYEPDVSVHVYKTSDMEWFKKFALDQDLRDILSDAL